jgi:fatty-acid desaturase
MCYGAPGYSLLAIDYRLLLGVALSQLWAFHQENLVDLFCHVRGWWGYRNYETKDHSVNICPFGYISWGQGWHNNHHWDASNYNFGKRWWEFDPGAALVRMIKK